MCSLATMFLYMVAELSGVGQVINALTGLDGLPVIIVEVVVTSIYTGELPTNSGEMHTKCMKQPWAASAYLSLPITFRVQ